MRWRSFGESGLKVTELCLGTMTLTGQADEETSEAILDTAFEGGIRFLDTADCYPIPLSLETAGASEAFVGRWMAEKKVRDDLVISTKAYFPMGREPIHRIDLYLCHGWDETTPLEETLRSLEDLKRQGKILYAGISNVRTHEAAAALIEAARLSVPGFDGLQPRYNLLQREAEETLLPLAQRAGLGVMVYNPIAGGLLSGKHGVDEEPEEGTRFALPDIGDVYRRRYWHRRYLEEVWALKRAAEDHDLSLVTAAVAWVLKQPAISSAIIGASRPDQLEENLAASRLELPPELRERLDQVWYNLPRRAPDLDTPRISDFHSLEGSSDE